MISMVMKIVQVAIHVHGPNFHTLENMMKETPPGMRKQVHQKDKMHHGMKQILIQQIIIGQDLTMMVVRMNLIQDTIIIKMKQLSFRMST